MTQWHCGNDTVEQWQSGKVKRCGRSEMEEQWHSGRTVAQWKRDSGTVTQWHCGREAQWNRGTVEQ